MQVNIHTHDNRVTLVLNGRFDFSAHREFRAAYESALANKEAKEVEVDLGAVEYLDSSALGMLLLLKERAEAVHKTVALANCRGVVAQVLEVANFAKLFPLR